MAHELKYYIYSKKIVPLFDKATPASLQAFSEDGNLFKPHCDVPIRSLRACKASAIILRGVAREQCAGKVRVMSWMKVDNRPHGYVTRKRQEEE